MIRLNKKAIHKYSEATSTRGQEKNESPHTSQGAFYVISRMASYFINKPLCHAKLRLFPVEDAIAKYGHPRLKITRCQIIGFYR